MSSTPLQGGRLTIIVLGIGLASLKGEREPILDLRIGLVSPGGHRLILDPGVGLETLRGEQLVWDLEIRSVPVGGELLVLDLGAFPADRRNPASPATPLKGEELARAQREEFRQTDLRCGNYCIA